MIDLIPPFVFVDSDSRCWTLDRARIKVQGLSNSVWSFAKGWRVDDSNRVMTQNASFYWLETSK